MFEQAHAIVRAVSLETGVPVELIVSKSRQRSIVAARQECVRRIRKETSLSWSEINTVLNRAKSSRRPTGIE